MIIKQNRFIIRISYFSILPSYIIELTLPDGDKFSGEISLDKEWTSDLADANSAAFQNISLEFTNYVSKTVL